MYFQEVVKAAAMIRPTWPLAFIQHMIPNADQTYDACYLCASNGMVFTTLSVLNLSDPSGHTIAHQMASVGHKFDPLLEEDILNLVDNNGRSVATTQLIFSA